MRLDAYGREFKAKIINSANLEYANGKGCELKIKKRSDKKSLKSTGIIKKSIA